MLYLADGTKIPNQKWYSATDEQVLAAIDTRINDGTLVVNKREIDVAHAYPTYTLGNIDSTGAEVTGTYNVTDYLPVVGNEVLTLSNSLVSKVAYFDMNKTFISLVTIADGINDYVVPNNASWARFINLNNGGNSRPLYVRRKKKPTNKSFLDLIRSPLKTVLNIGITGDSNTYGYGLSDVNLAWSYLLSNEISNIQKFKYDSMSEWVECVCPSNYASGHKFIKNQEFSIWTDTNVLNLEFSANYSSTWKWFVDGVESGTESSTTIELDGNPHKVTVLFTGGQAVHPQFVIEKTINFENVAVSGVGIANVNVPTGKDWLIVMIGTNSRNTADMRIKNEFLEYARKGTYIVPFPNHKEDSSYTYSQLEQYSIISSYFKAHNYEIVDCSDVNAFAFYDNTLYQQDLIHYNEAGHRVICNMVSAKMGLPTMFKTTE